MNTQTQRKRYRNDLRLLAQKGNISQLKRMMKQLDEYDDVTPLLPKTGLTMKERRKLNRHWTAEAS